MKCFVYATKERPPMIGGIPMDGLLDITCEFLDRTFDPIAGCDIWGIVTYNRELTQSEIDDYELVSYCVG